MVKIRYQHTLSLTEEEEQTLEELQKKKWAVIDIFRLGMKEATKNDPH